MYAKQYELAEFYGVSWLTIHRHIQKMKEMPHIFPSECFIYNDVHREAFDYYWRNRRELKDAHLRKKVLPFRPKGGRHETNALHA